MIIKHALHQYAIKSDRKFKDRHLTIGASDIGKCIRQVWYSKNRIPADDEHTDGWGARKRGSVFEDHFFVPAMRNHYGDKLLYAGKQQKTLRSGNLTATPDGLLVDQPSNALADLMVPDIGPSQEIVIECKSIDPRVNLNEAKYEHVFQAQVQMGLFRETTEHSPDYAVISYTNASFFDDGTEFVTKFDPEIYANAKLRADKIMHAASANDCQPEGWQSGGRECEYCPWAKQCAQLRGDVPDETLAPSPADSQFIAELSDLARAERELDAKSSAAKTEQRKIQEEIKQKLKAKGLRKIKTDDLTVNWSSVKGRPSWNMQALREAAAQAGIDIEAFSTVGEQSDRLTIQVAKQDRLVTIQTDKG